jgi:hypothetical protein
MGLVASNGELLPRKKGQPMKGAGNRRKNNVRTNARPFMIAARSSPRIKGTQGKRLW